MEGPKSGSNNKSGHYPVDKPVEPENSNEGETGNHKVSRSGKLERQVSGLSTDSVYSATTDEASGIGEREVDCDLNAKSKLRIKPRLERQLSDPIKSLLKDKMDLGFDDPRFVEPFPEDDVPDVDSMTDPSEAHRVPAGNEREESLPLSPSHRPGQKEASLSNPVVENITVQDKKNIQQMVDQLLKKTKDLLPKYTEYIDIVMRPILKSFEAGGHSEDAENLYEALHRFSAKLKQGMQLNNGTCRGEEYRALINAYGLLGDLVEDDFNGRMVLECKARLRKVFGCYQNPSEESFLRARAQLGLDVNVAKVDGGYEVSSQIVGCDDTKIRVFLNQKLSLRVTAGNDIAKGYAAGVIGRIDGKVFNNLDEFIDFYADNVLLSLHKPRPGRGVKRATYTAVKDKKHREKVIAELPLLEKTFRELKLPILDRGHSHLKYGSEGKNIPLKIKRDVSEAHAGARIYKVAGIDRTAIKWGNTFTKKLPLLQQLENHPEWLSDYQNRCFNMSISEDLKKTCIKHINNYYPDIEDDDHCPAEVILPLMSRRLAVVEDVAFQKHRKGIPLNEGEDAITGELKAFRESAGKLLKENYQEYKDYCRDVNICRSDTSSSSEKAEARKRKASKEQQRGAKGSADMLKMMIVTHARLKDMHQRSARALGEETGLADDWLEDIGLDMSVPDIHVSEKDREQHLMLKKEAKGSIQFNDRIAKLALGPFEGLVDVRYIKNRDEPNPDSDGDYLYIALRGSMVGTASLAESSIQAALTKLMGTLPPVDGEAGILIDPAAGVDTVLQGLKHLKMELFFVKGEDGNYHLQYKRRLTGEEVAAKAGGKVPVTGAVSISGQVAADRYDYHFKGEDIGTNTMTYVMTRYNGWMVGGKPESWKAFTSDKDNRLRLAKIMVNMAKESENAGKELKGALEGVRSYYQGRAVEISEQAFEDAKAFLKQCESNNLAELKDIEEKKNQARRTIALYHQHKGEGINKEDQAKARAIMEQSAQGGSWEKSFDALKKQYEMHMAGTGQSTPGVLDKVERVFNHFIAGITKFKNALDQDAISPEELEMILKDIHGHITEATARLDTDKEIIDHHQIAAMEHQIGEMKKIELELRNFILEQTRWQKLSEKVSRAGKKETVQDLLSTSLEKLTKASEKYKALYAETGGIGGERTALESLVRTNTFDVALHSFNQLLAANYPTYLQDADGRFTDINPNKPLPFGRA